MKTVIENLEEKSLQIQDLLRQLLLEHSSIYLLNRNDPYSRVAVISPSGSYAYKPLEIQGRQIQSQVLEEYRKLFSVISILLHEQPKSVLSELQKTDSVITRIIEQRHTWNDNIQKEYEQVTEMFSKQIQILDNLYSPAAGDIIYVPDTNALLYNHDLQNWEFEDNTPFILVLLPVVLRELDELKMKHNNPDIRSKSESLIRQIKEFRRRGKLTEGVTLSGKNKVLSVAVEPDVNSSLPWLKPDNNDDQLIASTLEVMRMRPRSIVVSVSRDINFQNKAEFANMPFIEPPEPKQKETIQSVE